MDDVRKISLLGSTGSIGCSTLDVARQHPDKLEVVALAANSNVEKLAEQALKFHPRLVCIVDSSCKDELAARLNDSSIDILSGQEGLLEIAGLADVDLVVNAVVGAAGLLASLEVIKNGKLLALANKESLVAGGPLFPDLLKKHGGKILPIDSEHSAIWQAAMCGKASEIRRVIITASGGPFRTLPKESFENITVEQALNHPTWKMGRKITIDSATMANKGLEVIEAVALFSLPIDKVEVVIHPQSIVHSVVEYIDSSMIAQLSSPDMRLPISYALFWPDRVESDFGRLDLAGISKLTFEPPDFNRFPALNLAFEVARTGGTAPAVYNAANEAAVEAFLAGRIRFPQITELIAETVDRINVDNQPTLNDILAVDCQARKLVEELIGKLALC